MPAPSQETTTSREHTRDQASRHLRDLDLRGQEPLARETGRVSSAEMAQSGSATFT